MSEEKYPSQENFSPEVATAAAPAPRKRVPAKPAVADGGSGRSAKARPAKVKPAKVKPVKASVKPAGKTRAPRLSRYTQAGIEAIFRRFQAANPAPVGELDHSNAYTLLVAVVLSAQATDVGVNKATRELFRLADTPEKMLALGEYRVSDLIKTIGLFRTKAKNVIALSQILVDRFGGAVPDNREALMQLPGVGQKTANVVLNIAFGQSTIAVDTHIFRLANRLGLAPGRTPALVEAALEKVIPTAFKRHSHHWLILHGRYICKARTPDCHRCLIADLCKYAEKTSNVAFQGTTI